MQYRTFPNNTSVSLLGYGCMRFSKTAGKIDIAKAEREILAAIDAGVNYFDTAYIYPGSEAALGEILARNKLRDRVFIADKMPGYLVKSRAALDRYFEEMLRRLQTNYIDFFLIHMLADVAAWEKLKRFGIEEWLASKCESGAIRRVGFSFHGDSKTFCALIDVYPWDFAQIQYNYVDKHTQAGRKGLDYAAERNIPVVIMEPLRGGSLVSNLPEEAVRAFSEYDPVRTPADWAFSWLFDQPNVGCVLSGMNSLEMIEENVRTASEVKPNSLTDKDKELFERVVQAILTNTIVGCTGCSYCMPCPYGVDIPFTFNCLNKTANNPIMSVRMEYMQVTSLKHQPSNMLSCTSCGACAQHCPQHIAIPEQLERAKAKLLPWYIRIGLSVARRFIK